MDLELYGLINKKLQGKASLVNGKVPSDQLPSYVDDVINGYYHDNKFYEDSSFQTEITGEEGKIYVDLLTNNTYRWSGVAYVKVNDVDLSGYQPLLVSGTNIKTINGASVLGSGDLVIATNQAFKSGWRTNGTTKQFCDDVNADSSATQGLSFIGEVTFSDLPSTLVNAEITASIMAGSGTSNKVIHLVCTSGNVAPYRWEYTYWNNGSSTSGWVTVGTQVVANPTLAGTESALSGLQVGSTKYKIEGQKQADWTQSNNSAVDFIKNKPNLGSLALKSSVDYTTEVTNKPSIPDAVAANPTLAGSEAELTGLQVGNTKYKITQKLVFTNVTASNWVADVTYADYGYKCDLTCQGITANSIVEVMFGMTEATSGDYAPVCETSSNTVTLYSKVNTSITIPVIKEI